MKEFKIVFLVETESDTYSRTLERFTDLKSAQKEYKKAVKNSHRGRTTDQEDFKEYLNESVCLDEWENNSFSNTLQQQIIYSEGLIDRMNYKGNSAINYYSKATYNGKELMHTMFFQGEKQMWGKKHKVPQSKLKEWYYR